MHGKEINGRKLWRKSRLAKGQPANYKMKTSTLDRYTLNRYSAGTSKPEIGRD